MKHISTSKSKTELVSSHAKSYGFPALATALGVLIVGCSPAPEATSEKEPPATPEPPSMKAAPNAEAAAPVAAPKAPEMKAAPTEVAKSPAKPAAEAPAATAPETVVATPQPPAMPKSQNPMEALMAEAQQKQVALQAVNMQLQAMQDKAMEGEALKESMKELENKAVELMSTKSDTAAADYNSYKALLEELEQEPSLNQPGGLENASPEIKEKVEKLQGLGQKLQPLQAEVQQNAEIQTLQSNLMAKMLKTMEEQNPEFTALNEKREGLVEDIQEIQGKFRAQMMLQQQLQQQMQGGGAGEQNIPMPPVPKAP